MVGRQKFYAVVFRKLTAYLCNARIGLHQGIVSVSAECTDDFRTNELKLRKKVISALLYLSRVRIPVLRRTALEHVTDEYIPS